MCIFYRHTHFVKFTTIIIKNSFSLKTSLSSVYSYTTNFANGAKFISPIAPITHFLHNEVVNLHVRGMTLLHLNFGLHRTEI